MTKRTYHSPVLFGMDDGGSETIPVRPSQGVTGDKDIFNIDAILNHEYYDDYGWALDDTDFQAMDTDENLIITLEEFIAYMENIWLPENGYN